MKFTLFIPTRNEINSIKRMMPQVRKEWVDEILIVDGDSTDGTPEWFRENGYKVVNQKSKGLCGAYWECLETMEGDVMIPFSPDGNSIPEIIPLLVEKMKEGYDMIIASRYAGEAKSEDDDPVTGFGNWMFTKMTNLLYGSNYTDVLVMYRAFKIDLFKRLELEQGGLPVLEMQMAIRCAKRNLKTLDIPADEPKRIDDARKMSPLYNGSALLYTMVRELFVWRSRNGK